ncbi:hypothetical protein ACIRNI_10045 [Streptomyces sp. NPDC093546]|uniref:hypothetical protein n=1 Tax=Streptomyces sp. NPDC093546 TaxID=3366040 RepID=UPI00380760AD
MRQRIVRLALVAGVTVLALLLLLATCGGGADDPKGAPKPTRTAAGSAAPATRLTAPAAYDTRRGWELPDVSAGYVVDSATGLVAYLEAVGEAQYRVRTVDATTGKPRWTGRPWHPLGGPGDVPRLLALAKDGRSYVVTWSYGSLRGDPLAPASSFVSLDVYDAADGARQRVEVPWPDAPIVTATGPGVVISDGKARSAVVAPDTGEVTTVAPEALGPPKGCPECRTLTEVRGMTPKGLLVSGARSFWVRGGWASRGRAPSGADVASGVPTSLTPGHVLARWQHKKGARRAATHDIWAVHDVTTGVPLVQTECRKPAIEPGEHPRAVTSPGGRYLIAGSLAFDLDARTGRCFENPDGTSPLTLTTATDDGVVYGASSARSPSDALAGRGTPVRIDLATGVPEALAPSVRLPEAEVAGVGLFRWTDPADRVHLIAYVRRG